MGRTVDGIHIIHLGKTWEKLMVAARVIVAIENPSDIVVASQRPYGSRAVLKFSQYTGANAMAGRWMPGTLTNQITKKYLEPRLLIVTDPRTDAQALKEASYASIPVVALCDTDSPTEHVDGTIPRSAQWDVMVDSFFWRDPEELERQEEAEGGYGDNWGQKPAEQWDTGAGGGNWDDMSSPQANDASWENTGAVGGADDWSAPAGQTAGENQW